MRVGIAAAVFALAGLPASGHRLDEYLQGTLLSVDKDRLEASMTLTPGVAVFPFLIADIDTDGNGTISEAEQRAYAGRVLHDLSLTSEGSPLTPKLVSVTFPTIADMKEGRGEIRLSFHADLPPAGRNRELTIENRHQSRISAYQVNCLVPLDPHIRISAQTRNYSQSRYQLEYVQTGVPSVSPPFQLWSGGLIWLGSIGLLLFTRFMFLRRQHI
jgi:hypothetical protein